MKELITIEIFKGLLNKKLGYINNKIILRIINPKIYNKDNYASFKLVYFIEVKETVLDPITNKKSIILSPQKIFETHDKINLNQLKLIDKDINIEMILDEASKKVLSKAWGLTFKDWEEINS